MLFDEVTRRARDYGLNLSGVVAREDFDACQPKGRRAVELQPDCGSILVFGSGGRSLWERAAEEHDAAGPPKVREHVHRAVEDLVQLLHHRGKACRSVYPEQQPWLNFLHLGEMAGLGTVSPVIGMLLHPEFGPWLRLRAAILVPGQPFGNDWRPAVAPSFQPCLDCSRPCTSSCPAEVFDGQGSSDVRRCADHRHTGGCDTRCDARMACPIGDQAGYCKEEEEIRHQDCLRVMRRHYGMGVWRMVPSAFRRCL